MSTLLQYLQLPVQQDGKEYKSPYIAALLDARAATGRDLKTGAVLEHSKTGTWSGALAYLVLIDHIGSYITKVSNGNTDNRSFMRALIDFSTLNPKERFALYALRCAFAHNYSLINVGKGVDAPMLHHQFEVDRSEDFIIFPVVPWDGVRQTSTHNVITRISLKKLGDFVEQIHQILVAMATSSQLAPAGELIYIFFIKFPNR